MRYKCGLSGEEFVANLSSLNKLKAEEEIAKYRHFHNTKGRYYDHMVKAIYKKYNVKL